jgi:hypothetical protein
MSDLFLKNNIRNNSNNITDSSINIANILGVNNKARPTNNLSKINNTFRPINNNIVTESSINLPNILGMNNSNNYVGGNYSITSSANLSKINTNDVNHLLSMLTSESNANTENTNELENKLKNMLTQNGGADDTENTQELENKLTHMLNQSGGDDENTEMLENKINNILKTNQSGGAMKSLFTLGALGAAGTVLNSMLNKSSMTETSEFNVSNVIGPAPTPVVTSVTKNNVLNSATSSEMPQSNMNVNNLSETSANSINSIFTKRSVPPINPPITQNNFVPAMNTTTTINNNSPIVSLSETSSMMPMPNNNQSPTSDNRLNELIGGSGPALVAFREISAMVAKKLNIPNGPNAKKIAGQLQRDTKEKNMNITHDKLVEAAKKQLENNLNKYEKMV